jgi:hypothetical protein
MRIYKDQSERGLKHVTILCFVLAIIVPLIINLIFHTDISFFSFIAGVIEKIGADISSGFFSEEESGGPTKSTELLYRSSY